MIEAGVEWPEGAKYAAQDKDTMHVRFYEKGKPFRNSNVKYWDSLDGSMIRSVNLPELCSNWHQTIVTSEQYAKAVAAINNEQKPQYCASVMRQMPDNTIEQLAAEYHTKAAEACRLQSVADEALKDADDALYALEKAGELIGLVISIATKMKPVEQPTDTEQPVITDWCDLQVGDVIECTAYNDKKDDPWPGGWATQNIGTQQVVSKINDSNGKISIKDNQDSGYAFKFIRRP